MQIFYTVRSGDTLYSIAKRWIIPLISLINANNLPYPYEIHVGQQLSMPPGITNYVVKPNDSIYSISQSYGIPANIIIDANSLEEPYIIVPDQVLIVPEGVTYYVVNPGDTLYKIALKYNVVLNSQPRPDYIIKANPGLTSSINPGTSIIIPYPPPGGTGKLAVILNDSLKFYLGLYGPNTGKLDSININGLDELSIIFYSPDQTQIALIGTSGVISIMNLPSMRISRIDQTTEDRFIDWSPDSRNVVYSNERIIRIYNVFDNTSKTINISNAEYVQYFSNGAELLYEAKDSAGISQLYKININGTNQKQLTHNTEFPLRNVRLSPNGRYVLYTSPGASVSEIYTIELATGTIYKIPGGLEGKNYNPT
jgi:TolB protein